MSIRVDPDWWKTMFDEVYLLTDARSVANDEITRLEVDLICDLLPLDRGSRVLDLCGGHGRHSIELCRRGYRNCILLDYSEFLLRRARAAARQCTYPIGIIRADARSTGLRSESLDRVLIMGNSLGYHDSDADAQIIAECRRVLVPGGWVLADLADGMAVREKFVPEGWHEGAGIVVCRRREMREDRVFVRELVLSKQRGMIRDRNYSIRIFEPDEVIEMLEGAGFGEVRIVGDFSPHRTRGDYGFMNYRMIALGRKK
jgi:D-alanine-D-alanine ligase